jgi:midasin
MDIPNNWDALSIPFQAQIDQLLIDFPDLLAINALPTQEKLVRLSNLLKNTIYAIRVARLFSPLLVDLCARWLDDEEQDEAKFAVFALLVPAYEELYPYGPF